MQKFGLFIGGLLTLGLTACGTAAPVKATVPSHPEEFKKTQPGTSLMAIGYTPAVTLFDKDGKTPVGVIYVDCSADPDNIAKCADDLHNRGTDKHPNVYVLNSKDGHGATVYELEGQHDNGNDDRSYRVAVPANFQDFSKIDEKAQTALLTNTMPTVAAALGAHADDLMHTVPVKDVDNVIAWASRG